jgi:gluconolactonase
VIEVLGEGFDWTEGPIWVKDGGYLLFSDIPRNSIYKWKEGEGVSLWMSPSGYTGVVYNPPEPGSNGLTLDLQGRLCACEHGDRRVSRLYKDGGKRTLVDNYKGKRLNSPNDLVFRQNGDLYFTDPPYGLTRQWADPRRELDFCGVYRLTPEGELTLLYSELSRPNGLAFSPDESKLYVGNSDRARSIWLEFPVLQDGNLGEPKLFADVTAEAKQYNASPDGLKVDQDGNIWATGPGGITIFTPDATPLGRIETGQKTANCNWGDDGSTLYIAADMYVCRVKTTAKGAGWPASLLNNQK